MKEYGILPLPNVAQIIPPETRSGQRALNETCHIADKVILPDPFCVLSPGIEFVQGYAFQSQIVSQVDEAGLVIDNIVPRAEAYQFCEKLPCSYTVPGLYGRAGFRLWRWSYSTRV